MGIMKYKVEFYFSDAIIKSIKIIIIYYWFLFIDSAAGIIPTREQRNTNVGPQKV